MLRSDDPGRTLPRQRRRRQWQERLEKRFHPEVGERAAEENRRQGALGNGVGVELLSRSVEQIELLAQRPGHALAQARHHSPVIQRAGRFRRPA